MGRFELASGGTVFLDEIGEVPLELQPKLLRVLQEREFERLGSSRTLRSDARLIAATNRDLAAMVEAGTFRADLFYRLNVFPIHVPSLRERPEDIPLLVRHFVQQLGRRMNKVVETIPAETMTALTRYDWPGNIRELQNLIERAMILTRGPVLRVPLDDLKSARASPAGERSAPDPARKRSGSTSSPRSRRPRLGPRRPERRGRTPRAEPLHAPVPDEEAGDRPPGAVTPEPRSGESAPAPVAVPARWHSPAGWRQPWREPDRRAPLLSCN